jgi:hypothetical protein
MEKFSRHVVPAQLVLPAHAGIQVCLRPISLDALNSQTKCNTFCIKVLQWDDTMNSFRLKSGARFPNLAKPGKQSAASFTDPCLQMTLITTDNFYAIR